MLHTVLNKSWKQHSTKQQLYGHIPLISQIIQVRQTKYVGHCWISKKELISNVLWWAPTYWYTSSGGLSIKTYISSMWTQDTVQNTRQKREREREKERVSQRILSSLYDDDDDDDFTRKKKMKQSNRNKIIYGFSNYGGTFFQYFSNWKFIVRTGQISKIESNRIFFFFYK